MSTDETSTMVAEGPMAPARPPDPEVVAPVCPRQFSVEYKRHILEEADCCTRPGEVEALL